MTEHKTRDIYLAAYCVLNGCNLLIERSVGSDKVVFKLNADEKKADLKNLIDDYFNNRGQCDPKALKFRITDIKNQLYSILDNR